MLDVVSCDVIDNELLGLLRIAMRNKPNSSLSITSHETTSSIMAPMIELQVS